MVLVEDENADVLDGTADDLAAGHGLYRAEMVRRQLGDDVGFAGREGVEPARQFRHDAEHQLLHRGSAAEIGLVGLQHQMLVDLELGDGEGAGADGSLFPGLEGAGGEEGAPVDDLTGPAGEALLDERVGGACHHAHLALAHRLDALDGAEEGAAQRMARGLGVGDALGTEAEGDVGGCKDVAIVEAHTLAQVQLEDARIGPAPGGGEAGLQPGVVAIVHRDQRVENVVGGAEKDVGDLTHRLQHPRTDRHGDGDASACALRQSGSGEPQRRRGEGRAGCLEEGAAGGGETGLGHRTSCSWRKHERAGRGERPAPDGGNQAAKLPGRKSMAKAGAVFQRIVLAPWR